MPRDYYEVLGVERGAGEREIKKAFRTLARELHPDVSDAADAEERFKEVAAAYEVLSDQERRATYDRFGHEGLRARGGEPDFGGFDNVQSIFETFFGGGLFGDVRAASAPVAGADVGAAVEITLVDVVDGAERPVEFDAVTACERCHGNRAEPGTPIETCGRCGGSGRLRAVSRTLLGTVERAMACDACDGEGKTATTRCKRCAGRGRHGEHRSVIVEIPPGIEDGQQIRLRGKGHAGARGGPPGDLYVQVRVAEDDRFLRDGADLYTAIDLPVHEAMLGRTVMVETLDESVEVEITPGAQHGDKIELPGLGLPTLRGSRRGVLRAVLNLRVPRNLDAEQRELIERFGASLTEKNSAAEPEGMFTKLRRALR